MEQKDSRDEQSFNERKQYVDKLIPSPADRTKKVHKVLIEADNKKEISHWDLMCFCVAYLVKSIPVFPWLEKEALILSKNVAACHYYATEEVGLLPNIKVVQ